MLALAATPGAAAPDAAVVAEAMRRSVEELRSLGRIEVAGVPVLSAQALPAFYESREFAPLWAARGPVDALLGEIVAAEGDGLDPRDYHFATLRRALQRRSARPDDPAAAAELDLLLTDALIRLAAHLHFGRVDPRSLSPRWDLTGTVGGRDAVAVLTGLAGSDALPLQLGDLRPGQPLYGRLKAALARYRFIAADGGWPRLGGGAVMSEGMTSNLVPSLRRRLALTGDYTGSTSDSRQFDAPLRDALRRFQDRHGLAADGVLGPATRQALDRPVEARIGEVRVNLERARWLLPEIRGRFLIVDPAGRRVELAENSVTVHAQPATFAPLQGHVPTFRASLSYLVVNPDWTLPPGLVEAQVAPLAMRAPEALEPLGLVLHDRSGRRLAADAVDWSDPGAVVVHQLAAPRSFLGAVRFALPNPHQVTLHGGSANAPLAGSVRIANPLALAARLLELRGAQVSWSVDALAELAASGVTRSLALVDAVPVLHAPWTVWVTAEGTVQFRRGFETGDAALLAALTRAAPRSPAPLRTRR
jgi:murein L,D-transpeptidase YcbB/YkuD